MSALPYRFESGSGSRGGESFKLVVGVDFGTTYTGVSHVLSSRTARDISIIRSWPGTSKVNDNPWKTPTRIAYANENEGLDQDIIGFEVVPGLVSSSWMKLALDSASRGRFDDSDLSRIEGRSMLRIPSNKTHQEVCADFLRVVYSTIMDELKKQRLSGVIASTPMEFWFTVPAIWSDRAKADTKAAAVAAGFSSRPGDSINLISEPEAAAISVLTQLAEDGNDQIRRGEGILVVDCGGGTVDLTAYTIQSVRPFLEFKELVVGHGGKCGSTYIDREFHEWMRDRFGAPFDNVEFARKGPGSKFMKEFESIKMDFGYHSRLNQTFQIPLRMRGLETSENYDEEEMMVKFTKQNLETFFRPVVQSVVHLIEQQVDASSQAGKAIDKIILVGGFGESRYLFETLKLWCQRNGSIEVFCPEHPQAAIAMGAAIRGLGGVGSKPKTRKCRRYYGFQLDRAFDELHDDRRHMYANEFDHKRYVRGTMAWKVPMGCEIGEDTVFTQHVRKPWHAGESLDFTLKLYATSQEPPPQRQEHPRVIEVGTIKVNLTESDLSRFRKKWKFRQDRWVWQLEYDLHIFPGGREGTLVFQAKCEGDVLGRTEIEYARE